MSDNATPDQTAQELFARAKDFAQNGQIAQALPLFRETVDLAPHTPRAHYCLALAYHDTGQFDDAIEIAQQGINTQDDIFDLLVLLAACLREKKETNDAITALEKANSIQPWHPAILLNLTILHFDKGQKDKVREYAMQTLEIAPMATQAHYFLTKAHKYTSAEDDHLATMRSILQHTTQMSPHDIAYLHFAMAKAYEDIKNYDTAFNHYANANEIIRNTYDFSISNIAESFAAIRDTLSASNIRTLAQNGSEDKTPAFIVGMPRSGTSLVEQILASHKDVYGAGEKKEIEQIKNFLLGDTPAHYRGNLSECTAKKIASAAEYYLSSIADRRKKHHLIIDKMPMNFSYIGLIKILFPKAKIIHCVRTPQDTCLSIFRSFFGDDVPYAYNIEEITSFYRLYQEQMQHWKTLFPDDIYDISYESLVDNQEQETEKLLAFCDLDWDDACLHFYQTGRAVNTASSLQATQPIYKSSVNYWMRYKDMLPDSLSQL